MSAVHDNSNYLMRELRIFRPHGCSDVKEGQIQGDCLHQRQEVSFGMSDEKRRPCPGTSSLVPCTRDLFSESKQMSEVCLQSIEVCSHRRTRFRSWTRVRSGRPRSRPRGRRPLTRQRSRKSRCPRARPRSRATATTMTMVSAIRISFAGGRQSRDG